MKTINHIYNIYYDEEGDFLEITIGEQTECSADEIDKGVFVRKDEKTGEVKSIGILSFKKRAQNIKEFLQKVNIKLPIKISF